MLLFALLKVNVKILSPESSKYHFKATKVLKVSGNCLMAKPTRYFFYPISCLGAIIYPSPPNQSLWQSLHFSHPLSEFTSKASLKS